MKSRWRRIPARRRARRGGPYSDAWAWIPLGHNYPTEEELEEKIPASAVHAFTGPKATLISAIRPASIEAASRRRNPRVLATRIAGIPDRAELRVREALDDLDAPTRFALTGPSLAHRV